MNAQTATLLGVAVTAIITLIVGLYTARQSFRANREQTRAAPYEVLAQRVDKLEREDAAKSAALSSIRQEFDKQSDELAEQSEHLDALSDALWEQHAWQQGGANPPPPTIASRALELLNRIRHERGTAQEEP